MKDNSNTSPASESASPQGRFRPSSHLGLGGVAIGNGFAPATDAQSQDTLQDAWDGGIRYFDTSLWYGLGLSECRMGHDLHRRSADDYVISSKVGRLLTATTGELPQTMSTDPLPFRYRYDYPAADFRRSVEDSLPCRAQASRISSRRALRGAACFD